MENNGMLITHEGLQKLKDELKYLVEVENKIIIEELQAARAQGDLSENADYDAARDRQARVDARIRELDNMIANAIIIDDQKGGAKVVKVGSKVTLLDLATNEEEVVKIVGTEEADPFEGKISHLCALSQAILERSVNDEVLVNCETPYTVKIVKIERN